MDRVNPMIQNSCTNCFNIALMAYKAKQSSSRDTNNCERSKQTDCYSDCTAPILHNYCHITRTHTAFTAISLQQKAWSCVCIWTTLNELVLMKTSEYFNLNVKRLKLIIFTWLHVGESKSTSELLDLVMCPGHNLSLHQDVSKTSLVSWFQWKENVEARVRRWPGLLSAVWHHSDKRYPLYFSAIWYPICFQTSLPLPLKILISQPVFFISAPQITVLCFLEKHKGCNLHRSNPQKKKKKATKQNQLSKEPGRNSSPAQPETTSKYLSSVDQATSPPTSCN